MKQTKSRIAFRTVNALLLAFITVLCVTPLLHLLAVSLSHNKYASAGVIGLWPKGFTLEAYNFLSKKSEFLRSLSISVERVVLGTIINMTLCVITAYPLSRDNTQFRARTFYVWYFAITMFFGGGLIPTYFVIKTMGLVDSIWALILPGGLSVWNMVMMLNFFRGIPKSLEEAARLDGATHPQILFRIFLPLSLPSLATILLFTTVGHWNSWFDGFIYMNSPTRYPLQTYLSTLITNNAAQSKEFISQEELERLQAVSNKTLRTAQIFLGALPIMCVYPFVQRYFIKGIVLGSVKE
ncbi:MAG: carbohydrate ABC transporter permease [Clostridiales bacterium]|nr:carbohydrate ABC transporter permease [Clostridiales bacterium]